VILVAKKIPAAARGVSPSIEIKPQPKPPNHDLTLTMVSFLITPAVVLPLAHPALLPPTNG
jgi:hypothetical protein